MLLPETLAHEDDVPPDSRGFYPNPYADPRPAPLALLHIAGGYLAAPDAPTAPCDVCGKEQPVAMTLAQFPGPYGLCPARENIECVERGLAQLRAAMRAQEDAEAAQDDAPADDAAGAPQEATATAEGAGKRTRPSKAREAALKKPAEPAVAATSAGSADPPGGDAA
jgi:hypothetical protein